MSGSRTPGTSAREQSRDSSRITFTGDKQITGGGIARITAHLDQPAVAPFNLNVISKSKLALYSGTLYFGPGTIDTPILDPLGPDAKEGFKALIPRGEMGRPEEIADAVLRVTGKPQILKRYVEDRPSHDRRYLLDHSKIQRELGWRPAIPFEAGLRQTIEWYGEHRAWWAAKKKVTLDEFAWETRPPVESRK